MFCFGLGVWIIASSLAYWWERAQGRFKNLFPQPASVFAVTLGHLGLGIVILGMVGTSFWTQTTSALLDKGQETTLHDYRFTFQGIKSLDGPNYNIDRATLHVTRDNQPLATLQPEKRWYPIAGKDTTEVAIHPAGAGDLYIALGTEKPDKPGTWLIKLYYHPLVNLLWSGVVVMVLGGLFALYSHVTNPKAGSKP
ncbi:MAG TPA: cytochrome c-type biogenesis CcmF C-terminal domain-containing protein, partial [Alphaproteobacteria bacterium]